MADANEPVLLVNPGGVVVAVTAEHAATLLETDEGWEKAPKNAKEGDTPNGVNPVEAPAGNDLVPRGSSEDEAKEIADLQGTPENAKRQAAADPTNDDVVTAPAEGDDVHEDCKPGAGAVGDHNTDNGDHPNTTGQENSTAADEAVGKGNADTGNANEPADDGKKAGRFFGRKK